MSAGRWDANRRKPTILNHRAGLAALAVAATELSTSDASTKPTNIPLGPNKLILKLFKTHLETNSQCLGIRKIGFGFYRVNRVTAVRVHANCTKHIVRVSYRYLPLPFLFK